MKKAIVLGATSGIGREVARQLVDKGYLVAITGRRVELLDELKAENPEKYRVKALDVTQLDELSLGLDCLVKELGGLDLLVINSGTGHRNPTLDYEIEHPALMTNVLGFTAAVAWGYRFFEQQKSGHIAAITSVAGIRGNRFAPAYGASKAYGMHYLKSLRHKAEKEKANILVTDIRPGFVDTVMAQGDGLFWVATVEKAARQIVEAIEKRKKCVYVTKRWRAIAWLLPLIPNRLYHMI